MAIFLLNYISIPIYDLLIKKKRAILVLVSLQLFLILALRADTLGVDLVDYKVFYEHYRTMPLGEILRGFRVIGGSTHVYGVDSGYVLFNWIVGKLGFSFHSFLVIYAGIVVSSVAVFIDRYCKDIPIALATFVSLGGFVAAFGILRQSLALAIFLCAIPALVDRKFWKFLLIIFAAGLFHQTFYLALLLYPLSMLKANRTLFVTVMAASALLLLIIPPLYNQVLFPIFVRLGRYYYIDGFAWNNFFLLLIGLAVLIMIFFRREEKFDNAMLCGFLMTLPFQAIAFYLPVFSRLAGAVFINFACQLISNMLSSFETRSQRVQGKTIAYVGLLLFHVYALIVDGVLIPYVPFWA